MPKNEVIEFTVPAPGKCKSPREPVRSQNIKADMVTIEDTSPTVTVETKSAWRTFVNIGKEVRHDTAKAFRTMRRKMSRKGTNSVKQITLEQEEYEDPRWACKSAESTGSRHSDFSTSVSTCDSGRDDEIEVIYDADCDDL